MALPLSLAAFALALVVNYAAGSYADRIGDTAHTSPDLLLRFLPALNLRFLYLWGYGAFIVFAVGTAWLQERQRIGYLARIFALVITARSILMILTPMKIPEGALPVDGDWLYASVGRFLTMHNDLFFSSHTAIPFLAALVYRGKAARLVFLAWSVVMAATVLLMRQHYSIDVAGAYLITYALVRAESRWIEAPYRRALAG